MDQNHLAIVELLINKGADVATVDNSGVTPLHVVAQTDHIAIAELLITEGVDISAKDNNPGFTPLDYALDGEEGMNEALKRHGAICTTC